MKQIFKNFYIEIMDFSDHEERSYFLTSINNVRKLDILETFGSNYYCCIWKHSLTKKPVQVLTFSSYSKKTDLYLAYYKNYSAFVINTGENSFWVDGGLASYISLHSSAPFIGLYLTDRDNLLLVEETSIKTIDETGKIVKTNFVGFIENFEIDEKELTIKTQETTHTFSLD